MEEHVDKKWYILLKRKYKLTNDDMEEYIDSYNSINKGNRITPTILLNFINQEVDEENKWTLNETTNVIKQINKKINDKNALILDLQTYLLYIIPICQQYIINKIGINDFFNSLDTDNDGLITCKELTSILYKINKNFSPSDIKKYKKEIKQICYNADKNNDGYIDFEEFKRFMKERNII